MNSQTDQELLREYATSRSDAAFAELVRRHIDLIHSAALRMVRDAHLAEDVTQAVFIALAQNARRLSDRTAIAGWLHGTAQNLAANTVRTDVRRRVREQEAGVMNELLSADSEPTWHQIAPHLDEALGQLNDNDRDALLSRYFQRKSAREMAETLGVSEEAAQKRVNRALERLRWFLSRRGISIGASALGVVISVHATQAAPVALVTAISAAASTATSSILTITATQTIVMTTAHKCILATLLTAIVGAGIYETSRTFQLEDRVRHLESEQRPLTAQVSEFTRQRDDATNKLAVAQHENELLRRELANLPKLRGEVTRLQRDAQDLAQQNTDANDTNDPTQRAMKSWLKRVSQLKDKFEQMPEAKIPEFQLLTEQDWLNAAKGNLNDEKDYRRAMSSLRGSAENKFVNELQPALRKYLKEHNQSFPTALSELQPYFKAPVDEAILRRYEILPATDLPTLGMGGNWIISQKVAVDEEYDSRLGIGPNGYGSSGSSGWKKDSEFASAAKLLAPIEKLYKAAHNGAEPTDPADVLPYLTTPEQRAAYETLLKAHQDQEAENAK